MLRTPLFLALITVIVLSACNKPAVGTQTPPLKDAAEQGDAMPQQGDSMQQASSSMSDAVMHATMGVYTNYKEGIIGNGETSVLFFHASWCPICKKTDETLSQWYKGGVADGVLAVYKVDFDTAKELRSRYGVTLQHTFIKIDGEGKVIGTIQAPTDPQLLAFIM